DREALLSRGGSRPSAAGEFALRPDPLPGCKDTGKGRHVDPAVLKYLLLLPRLWTYRPRDRSFAARASAARGRDQTGPHTPRSVIRPSSSLQFEPHLCFV